MEAAELSYGSDQSGLVWGFRFGPGGVARPVDTAAAAGWLAEQAKARTIPLHLAPPQPEKGGDGKLRRLPGAGTEEFIWLHFNLSNGASEKWLRQHVHLADEFYEALHLGSRSTRIELAENTLIGVVNDVLHNFSFDAHDIATMWISVTPNIVITARRKSLQSIERLRGAVARGEPIRSAVELLVHLLRDQADVLVNIVRDAVGRVDDIEDKLLAGRLTYKREDLGSLRRVLVRLQRLLAPEPAALFRLLQRPPAGVSPLDSQELSESTEEFSVVLNDMASLQERIKLLQEESAARVNEENGRSLYVLTIVTVLALPINIIAGLLGMNVGGIPLAQHPHGFFIIAAIVATFTVVAGLLVIREQKKA
jgi:zinc transporter